MLKNAQIQYREEADEIAIYKTIQAFAEKVGDKDTAKLAKSILREEERMAKYVEGQIKQLSGSVVQAVVPRDQRGGTTRRRRKSSSSRKSSSASRSKSSSSRSKASEQLAQVECEAQVERQLAQVERQSRKASGRSTARKSSGTRKSSGAGSRAAPARPAARARSPRATQSQQRRPGPRGPGAFFSGRRAWRRVEVDLAAEPNSLARRPRVADGIRGRLWREGRAGSRNPGTRHA